jgi:hypothetical protein
MLSGCEIWVPHSNRGNQIEGMQKQIADEKIEFKM